MKTLVVCKKPYIDVIYTGEWKFRKEIWTDTHQFVEYYIGPFLFRHFYEQMDINRSSIR